MILIGGAIGSGKTTLVNQLLAGALNCGMTVAIGEAKGGLEVHPEREAFSMLAKYLAVRLQVKTYRWPRGNCWFNPLLYLNSSDQRRTFMNAIAKQSTATKGESQVFVERAASIATLVLEYLEAASPNLQKRPSICTLLNIVKYLEDVQGFITYSQKIEMLCKKQIEDNTNDERKVSRYKSKLKKLKDIKKKLERLDFLELATSDGRKKLGAQAGGIKMFVLILNDEDLLYYSASHDKDRKGNPLEELKLERIVYEPSLIVISQPLASDNPSANTVGPLFWEALLNYSRKLGLKPPANKDGKPRQDIAVFLDETHRLPVGSLGNAGDTLREYKIGLVEIIPSVGDRERWERNKHVYQTIFSSSPGVKDVYELVHEQLPERIRPRHEIGIDVQLISGELVIDPRVIDNEHNNIHLQGDSGVSSRGLRNTGSYTTLMYSCAKTIPDSDGLFWIDLESELLANLPTLLEDAINGDGVAGKLVDYALGLVQDFSL